MKESDLFEPIKNFLLSDGCSAVYGEVSNCDVLGINGSCNIIVELKSSLTFKVLDQALDRLRMGHYVYIAIPKRKNPLPRSVTKILTENRIGLLEVGKRYSNETHIYVTIPAKFNRLRGKKRVTNIRKYIKAYSDTQIGGVKSGEVVTDYSTTISNIKRFMKFRDWVTIEDILEHCETHYRNPKPSVIATLKANWNNDWCEIKFENKVRYFKYIRG